MLSVSQERNKNEQLVCYLCVSAALSNAASGRGSATPMKMGGGGRGPGLSEERIFFRGQSIPKTENSADLVHYFPENGGIIPRTLKNGGTRPPRPPLWRSPWLLDLDAIGLSEHRHQPYMSLFIVLGNNSDLVHNPAPSQSLAQTECLSHLTRMTRPTTSCIVGRNPTPTLQKRCRNGRRVDKICRETAGLERI